MYKNVCQPEYVSNNEYKKECVKHGHGKHSYAFRYIYIHTHSNVQNVLKTYIHTLVKEYNLFASCK